jgi:hypothetical protein
MMLLKGTEQTESGVMPGPEIFEAMAKYNEELVNAGVLLAGEGLQESSKGKRVQFTAEGARVIDGPFAETKELLAGFWIIQAKSIEEAVEWARRAPLSPGDVLEVRKVHDAEDFGEALTPEVREKERELWSRIAEQQRS